ncbi:MAG: SufE family protein [Bacteroidetes bacterium]|nr:SufE family protein [Bacteroidota bacterium]
MTINEIENEIIEEFELFGDDWEGKYEHIIDLGKNLPIIKPEYKTENNLIKGCQSKVWLHTDFENGKLIYTADSDAIITKGIVALMVRVLSNQPPKAIINAELNFMKTIGLMEHLSPTRANGLVSMINRMKQDAIKFNT